MSEKPPAKIHLLRSKPFVVTAYQIGILLRNRVAVNRYYRVLRIVSRQLIRDSFLDDAQRVYHLVFEQIPLRFARVPLLFLAPQPCLVPNSRHIQPKVRRLQHFLNIAKTV